MKRQFKFAKRAIEALPPCPAASASKELEYSDADTAGLRLLVNRQGRKSFLFRFTLVGRKRSMALGNYPAMDIAEARQKVAELRSMLAKGIDPQELKLEVAATPALSFGEFVAQDYLPHAYAVKRSAGDDESRLRLHILPEIGRTPLNLVKTSLIQQLHDRKRSELCPATANRLLALIKRVFNLAILWGKGDLERNPARGVKMHQESNQRHRYLAGEELRRFLVALDEEPNRAASDLFRLLLACGCRRQECLGAKWVDIDFVAARMFLPTSKNGRSRFVPLNSMALDILRQRPRMPGNPYVFPSASRPGEPMGPPSKAFRRVVQAAGITNFRLHDCRHTYASWIVQGGHSLQVAQALLGHQSATTTARYAHLTSSQLHSAAGGVSDMMRQATGDVSNTKVDLAAA